eukprot:262767-Alexandrium_andersonii.AAC.1
MSAPRRRPPPHPALCARTACGRVRGSSCPDIVALPAAAPAPSRPRLRPPAPSVAWHSPPPDGAGTKGR